MTRQIPAEAGTQTQRGGCSEDTTGQPVERGAVVVLVDANHTAVEIIEKRGDRYALELGEALLAPLRRVRTTGVPTHRVTWSAAWWQPSTPAKSRSFTRAADARRFATRKYADGYEVAFDVADRTPWVRVPLDDWLVAGEAVER